MIVKYLELSPTNTVVFRTYEKNWTGTPTAAEARSLVPNMERITGQAAPWWMITPKEAMWRAVAADYMPSDKPSHAACVPPAGNSPAPTIIAGSRCKSRLITSTLSRLATGHCFDAPYSIHFCPNADDPLTCPCKTLA